jgi:hypothetical protein
MLKRLLVMLSKSQHRKSLIKTPAKSPWHFSPRKLEKRISSLLNKEQEPPAPEVIAKIPMLKRWLERGREGRGRRMTLWLLLSA